MSNSQKKDPAWKYAEEIVLEGKSYNYLKCNFCMNMISGGVCRVKEHLACTKKNVKACPKVPDEVKKEVQIYMKQYQSAKKANEAEFEEIVDGGVFYSTIDSRPSIGDKDSCPSGSRGVRGPMDRYMSMKDGDEKEGENVVMSPIQLKELRNKVCLELGRFFYENAIAFNAATSASYTSMLRAVAHIGRDLKIPTMYDSSSWILKEEALKTQVVVTEVRETWKKTGVSLLSDGWTDTRNRSLINFLVNNRHGTVFLKTVDASDEVKNAPKLFELLDGVIDEIGEETVVQVITDNAAAYKAAGRMLMNKRPTLYWTPCAAHCIDLMLEKIGDLPEHKRVLYKAKKVTNYIHNHNWVLALARNIAVKDLVRPADTRFATAYLTLESMLKLKQPLQDMFVSTKWVNSSYAKTNDGKAVRRIIMDERFFWKSVIYAIKSTSPLVHVLRIVDGETPAMGFLYGAMDAAKEGIATNLGGDKAEYKEIWDIIDAKWEKQMHRDLHATGYYLNPQYRWSPNVSEHPEIKYGLYNCMERLVPDSELFAKIESQLNEFVFKRGLFGRRAATISYMTRSPVEWWENFGDDVPELKEFTLKILGLTCSASECERNWSTFNQVHTKRRNRLSAKKMDKLVFIMYNKKLKQRWMKKKQRKVGEDPLVRELIPSDDEWVVNPSDDEDVSTISSASALASTLTTEEPPPPPRKRRRLLQDFDSGDDEGNGNDDGDEENMETL